MSFNAPNWLKYAALLGFTDTNVLYKLATRKKQLLMVRNVRKNEPATVRASLAPIQCVLRSAPILCVFGPAPILCVLRPVLKWSVVLVEAQR